MPRKSFGRFFGPRHIIVAPGVNKLTGSLEEAVARVRSIAPMKYQRLYV
ncbi:MAG: lactate utilization protein [Treponema sp.]|nr:lactate utilization protein [Treponema sp.]